jgi:hypothetical protein
VVDGTTFACWLWEEERASVATALVGQKTVGLLEESLLQGHGQAGAAEGQTVCVEELPVVPATGIGHGREAVGLVEVVVDVEGIEGGIQCTEARLAPQVLLAHFDAVGGHASLGGGGV